MDRLSTWIEPEFLISKGFWLQLLSLGLTTPLMPQSWTLVEFFIFLVCLFWFVFCFFFLGGGWEGWGWSWFKFNNLRLAISIALKFYTSVAKWLKLNIKKLSELTATFVEFRGEKLVGDLFAPPLSWIGLRNIKSKNINLRKKKELHLLLYDTSMLYINLSF